jgi:hypothetical protein
MAIKIGGTTVIDDSRNLTNLGSAITAAQGGTGLTSPGTAGNVLTSNGTTWTSAAAPASAGSITATASGAITAGNAVVVNSNGTVSAVSGTPSTSATVGGIANTANGCAYTQAASWFDPSTNVIVWVYRNSDLYLYSVAGTVSGSTVTWGTAQVIYSGSVDDTEVSITGENNGTIVLLWPVAHCITALVPHHQAAQVSVGVVTIIWPEGKPAWLNTK